MRLIFVFLCFKLMRRFMVILMGRNVYRVVNSLVLHYVVVVTEGVFIFRRGRKIAKSDY